MNYYLESLLQVLGKDPEKPAVEEITEEAKQIHILHKQIRITAEEYHAELKLKKPNKWLKRRWLVLLLINFLFVISYQLDIQLLEGALTASRFMGFHMADLNSSLQVMLASKMILVNLFIGTATILLLWLVFGGRAFCSWVCPYHFLSEIADRIHVYLASKKIVKDRPFHRGFRSVFYILFAVLAIVTGYTVFEYISPTGIVSRALIYGSVLGLIWVALLLVVEIFYSRRAWCRYVCPIGMTYAFVGVFSPLRIRYDLNQCKHEGECRKVCLVPHVLEPVIKGRARDTSMVLGADCTRCGACIDVCATGSLQFDFNISSKNK